MIPLVAAAALAGLFKSATFDKQKEQRDRDLAANTQRLSPWTGLKAGQIQEPDPFGSAVSFASMAGGMQNSMKDAAAKEALMKAQTGWLNSGGSPQYTSQMATTNLGGGGTAMNPYSNWDQAGYGSYGPISGSNYGASPNQYFGL